MDDGLIYEEGSLEQIFGNPQREKTRIFIHRIRSCRHEIVSPDYDLYTMNAHTETFCERQMLSSKTRHNVLLVHEEILQLYKPQLQRAQLAVSLSYAEKSGQLELSLTSIVPMGNPLDSDDPDHALPAQIVRNYAERIEFASADGSDRLLLMIRQV